jgi:hypothetical protein
MHKAGPLIPEPSSFGGEIAIKELKRYQSPDINQIAVELIQAGGNNITF